ncbi:hypothetical protein [Niveispirillum sp. BGYR6]|uniref:hypothetical protein n=1 Tax=Niveispirillum sp. BGYR6 TaxID=2971249 RepID=UPI0022B94854|nr:hypothetical protein [Niveispirillum sp. BGYR6]MDG5496759.1 hypothetical protein [Niveispirillum sp. BGYR6]
MDLTDLLTGLTLLFAALKLLPLPLLLKAAKQPVLLTRMPWPSALYFTSKLSGILAVAFALAAAASAHKAEEVAGLSLLLVLGTVLTGWSIWARLLGRPFGLAALLHRQR